jgi:GNAT superfamily N-acetyltransferase
MTAAVTIEQLTGRQAAASIDALAEVLIDCVHGGASVGFMQSLTLDQAKEFWSSVANGVTRGERILLIARDSDGQIIGTVQLVVAQPPNQPHRADVAKMLVHRCARRRGIAQILMVAIDDAARSADKSVLVLDTVTGGDAERLYTRCGWQQVGVVPNYALFPDGTLCATTFFYKHL